ncbi:MAG: hypothetical protein ACRYFZ_24430 [Janthinobacterium lividum]
MHQPKKRWARTEAQQRHDQYGRSYYHNPPSAWQYERQAWKTHRSATRKALAQVAQGLEEAEVVFPYHHRHSLQWAYC